MAFEFRLPRSGAAGVAVACALQRRSAGISGVLVKEVGWCRRVIHDKNEVPLKILTGVDPKIIFGFILF